MALQFPNVVPDFIQVQLPEYSKNIQKFPTSDFFVQNFQHLPIGYIFEIKFSNMKKSDSDTLKNFYHSTKHQVFTLQSNFLSRFPSVFVSSLNLFTFWQFEGIFQINPKIVNKNFFLSEVVFKIKNVIS
jgi:hypothetical protein